MKTLCCFFILGLTHVACSRSKPLEVIKQIEQGVPESNLQPPPSPSVAPEIQACLSDLVVTLERSDSTPVQVSDTVELLLKASDICADSLRYSRAGLPETEFSGTSKTYNTVFFQAGTQTEAVHVRSFKNGVVLHEKTVTLQISVIAPSAVPLPPAPPAPFIAMAESATQITLLWNDRSQNETGFKIQRLKAGAFETIASLPANTITFTDTGLAPSATYVYRLLAFNSVGESVSDFATATTEDLAPPPLLVPLAPTNLSATASPTQVNLTWADNSLNESGYYVERSAGGLVTVFLMPADVTFFADTNLFSGTSYGYRVRAFNSAGTSPYSNVVTLTTPVPIPFAPTGLRATLLSETQIQLDWMDQSNDEDGFTLKIDEGYPGPALPTQRITLPRNATTYTHVSSSQIQAVRYSVTAFSAGGTSSRSNELLILHKDPFNIRSFVNSLMGNVVPDTSSLYNDDQTGNKVCSLDAKTLIQRDSLSSTTWGSRRGYTNGGNWYYQWTGSTFLALSYTSNLQWLATVVCSD